MSDVNVGINFNLRGGQESAQGISAVERALQAFSRNLGFSKTAMNQTETQGVKPLTSATKGLTQTTDELGKKTGEIANKSMPGKEQATEKTTQSLTRMDIVIGNLVARGLERLASSLMSGVGNMLSMAGQFESVSDSLGSMTQDMEIDLDQLVKTVKKTTGNTITELDIMKGATRALSLIGKESFSDFGAQYTKIAELSKKAARATGKDTQEIFNSLIQGVGTANTLLLRNAGINLTLDEVTREYAQSVGKTTSQLTQQEKVMATLNKVLDEGERIYGDVRVSAGGYSGALERLRIVMADITTQAGLKLAPAFTRVLNILEKDFVPLLKDGVFPILSVIADVFGKVAEQVAHVAKGIVALARNPIVQFVAGLALALTATGKLMVVVAGLTFSFKALALAMAANPIGLAIGAFITLSYVVGRFSEQIKGFLQFVGERFVNIFVGAINGVIKGFNWLIEKINSVGKYTGIYIDQIKELEYVSFRAKDGTDELADGLGNSEGKTKDASRAVRDYIADLRDLRGEMSEGTRSLADQELKVLELTEKQAKQTEEIEKTNKKYGEGSIEARKAALKLFQISDDLAKEENKRQEMIQETADTVVSTMLEIVEASEKGDKARVDSLSESLDREKLMWAIQHAELDDMQRTALEGALERLNRGEKTATLVVQQEYGKREKAVENFTTNAKRSLGLLARERVDIKIEPTGLSAMVEKVRTAVRDAEREQVNVRANVQLNTAGLFSSVQNAIQRALKN